MKQDGYIKLHRQLLDWEWIDDPKTLTVWIHLLLRTNWQGEREERGVKLQRGQCIFGRKELAQKTGLTERQIRTAIDRLKTTSELTTKTTNRFTIATIENWGKYQGADGENDQQNDQQSVRKTTTKEEYKEILRTNTQKENYKKKKGSEVNELIEEQPIALQDALRDFVKMRASIKKPMTTRRAMKQLLNKLYKLSGGDMAKAVDLLNEAILHNWQSVYEVKDKAKPRNEVLEMMKNGEI